MPRLRARVDVQPVVAAVRHARALEELVLAAVAEHRAELAELITLEKVVTETGKGEE